MPTSTAAQIRTYRGETADEVDRAYQEDAAVQRGLGYEPVEFRRDASGDGFWLAVTFERTQLPLPPQSAAWKYLGTAALVAGCLSLAYAALTVGLAVVFRALGGSAADAATTAMVVVVLTFPFALAFGVVWAMRFEGLTGCAAALTLGIGAGLPAFILYWFGWRFGSMLIVVAVAVVLVGLELIRFRRAQPV